MFALKLFLQCCPCSHDIRSHNSQRRSLQWTKTEHQKQPLSVLPFRCLFPQFLLFLVNSAITVVPVQAEFEPISILSTRSFITIGLCSGFFKDCIAKGHRCRSINHEFLTCSCFPYLFSIHKSSISAALFSEPPCLVTVSVTLLTSNSPLSPQLFKTLHQIFLPASLDPPYCLHCQPWYVNV